MRIRNLIAAIVFTVQMMCASDTLAVASSGAGSVVFGVGAVSSGGVSKLLYDYPEPYRTQVLDYLFLPNYGAAFQILKVEIGSDASSIPGSESTHMRSGTVQNYTRGYEWWLMQQFKARQPAGIIQALTWGAPGWLGNGSTPGCSSSPPGAGTYYSCDTVNYIVDFITGARDTYGLTIDYVGLWNESAGYNVTWLKALKAGIVNAGLSTKLIAADQNSPWGIIADVACDAACAAAIDVYGDHYPSGYGYNDPVFSLINPTGLAASVATGKPVIAAEDGTSLGTWAASQRLIKSLVRNYVLGKMTGTVIWSLIGAYPDIFPFPQSGVMVANAPWSGAFSVLPAAWTVAHLTQFMQPGWLYIDQASITLGGSGNCLTAQNPGKTDYSIACETMNASGSESITVNVSGTLSAGTVHVWKSDGSAQFIAQADITPVAGTWSATLAASSIYTFTTTTGQTKGSQASPSSQAFPYPYSTTFESDVAPQQPVYWFQGSGAFEVGACTGRSGQCLRQQTAGTQINWAHANSLFPGTFVGDAAWTNYTVSVDTLVEINSNLDVTSRLLGYVQGRTQSSGFEQAYSFNFQPKTGTWRLNLNDSFSSNLATGTIAAPGLNTWNTLSMSLAGVSGGTAITASINGVQVANIVDAASTYTFGMVGLGVVNTFNVQYDNFAVSPNPSAVRRGAASLRGQSAQR